MDEPNRQNETTADDAARYPAIIAALVLVGLGNFAVAWFCLSLASRDLPLNYAFAAVGFIAGSYLFYRAILGVWRLKKWRAESRE